MSALASPSLRGTFAGKFAPGGFGFGFDPRSWTAVGGGILGMEETWSLEMWYDRTVDDDDDGECDKR